MIRHIDAVSSPLPPPPLPLNVCGYYTRLGIWQFDTAAAYGDSEKLLGNALAAAGPTAARAKVQPPQRMHA